MFIALIKSDAVRAKVCSVPLDSDTVASHWADRPESEVYVGLFRTADHDEALRSAAGKAGVDPSNVRLIQLVAT